MDNDGNQKMVIIENIVEDSKFFILLSTLCWLMLQIIEGKREEILCYAIKIQVSKPDQVTKAFEVFVYLEWKISNFDY